MSTFSASSYAASNDLLIEKQAEFKRSPRRRNAHDHPESHLRLVFLMEVYSYADLLI